MQTFHKTKISLKKWIRTVSNFIDLIQFHLICQILTKFFRVESEMPCRSLACLGKEEENVCFVSTYSIKQEVSRRSRAVTATKCSLYTVVVLFFFSFFSKTSSNARERAAAVNKSPAVYILSRALDGRWRENRGSVNRLKKCAKKRDALAKLLFCLYNFITFLPISLLSPSSSLKPPINLFSLYVVFSQKRSQENLTLCLFINNA